MNNLYCFNKTNLLVGILIIIIIAFVLITFILNNNVTIQPFNNVANKSQQEYKSQQESQHESQHEHKSQQEQMQDKMQEQLYELKQKVNEIHSQEAPLQEQAMSPHVMNSIRNNDVIREYDYRKAFDPFEQPARRVARSEIHPSYLRRMIDLPTRGYPDNFTQYGVLIRDENKKSKEHDEQNKILRLFGRNQYPGSGTYEYYTMINSGLDQIKIPLHNKRRRDELYDGDTVYIRELNNNYTVSLHKYDEPKYYPDILF